MYSRINSSNLLSNSPLKSNNQNISYTLPVTCHICLGKVKEPSVCPNLHVFCSFCIEIWLEKTKQCPTCRIQINKENPCRRILGGVENFDEADALKPCEFSNEAVRKARFLNLFQQYEDEIVRLNKYIDSLNADITKLKESNNGVSSANLSSSPQQDMLHILKDKLKTIQATLDETIKEKDKLKESNKKLESENSILIQDIYRLKASLNERNNQLSSKYTLAALESKVESYEKEIKQLQKALDKSDKYIAELESKQRDKENGCNSTSNCLTNGATGTTNSILKENSIGSFSNLTSSSNNIYTSTSTLNFNLAEKTPANHTLPINTPQSPMKFIKGDNQTFKSDLKIVKFSEKIDTIPLSSASSSTLTMTSPPSHHSYHKAQTVISNDKFYGSPSKLSNNNSGSVGVSSFSERLKKNSNYDLETPILHQDIHQHHHSHNFNNPTSSNQQSGHQFLFSPMKRLRLDETNIATNEKPIVQNENMTEESPVEVRKTLSFKPTSPLSTPTCSSMPHHPTPFNHNYKSKLKLMEDIDDASNMKTTDPSVTTSEFIDCIELLNKAEQKVQNRHISPKTSPTSVTSSTSSANMNTVSSASGSLGLPEKYFRAVNILEGATTTTETTESQRLNNNLDSNNQITGVPLTKSLLASFGSPSSSSSSSTNSANSLSAMASSGSNSTSSYHAFSNINISNNNNN